MRTLFRLVVLVRSWCRAGRVDEDFGEELRFHLDREIQANMEQGMPEREARRTASLALGGLDTFQEIARDARPGALVRQATRGVCYGVRLLRRAPAFAASAIAIVALGIGAVAAIFSVLYGVVLQPPPFSAPDRLVNVWMVMPWMNVPRAQVNAADCRDWTTTNHVFDDIALIRQLANFNLVGDGEPERLLGSLLSPNFFSVVGTTPVLGRPFTDADAQPGHDNVVLISDALWKRRFAADPSIVGRTINLGTPQTVVGVMGAAFQYPGRDVQVWKPLVVSSAELTRAEPGNNYVAIGRLKQGISLQQAQSEMSAIAKRLEVAYPATNRGVGVEVAPILDETVRPVRTALYVMFWAVLCLLAIACLNLANLLAARAAVRSKEFAVRLALGASRTRLALQAFAEVAPILAAGGAAGVLLAEWLIAGFVRIAPSSLPRIENVGVNRSVLAFSLLMLLLTGLVAGLLPALQAWRSNVLAATKEGRTMSKGPDQAKARHTLVIVQMALVLPLLVGAGLLARTFSALADVNPGFQPANRLTLQLAISRSKYPKEAQVTAFCARLVERVASVPGVKAVGMVNRLPLVGVGQVGPIQIENAEGQRPQQPALDQLPSTDWRTVTPGYFQAMGIPLREGRLFTEHDTATTSPVGIIDERLARAYWPGQSAVGKRFRIPVGNLPWVEIVGVVGHVRHDGVDVDPRPQVYWNYWQRPQDRMALIVHTEQDVAATTPAVLQAVHEVDPDQPVYDVRSMSDVVERSLIQRWLNMTLVSSFAIISLVLSSMGVYGVIAYGVAQRRREFGIRLALGAMRSDVIRDVLRRGLRLALIGAGVGVATAGALAVTMRSVLYGVKPLDLVTFLTSTGVLFGVALLASYLPARRAAMIDPARTLRCD